MKNFCAIILALALIVSCACAETRPEFYPKLAVVVNIERIGGTDIIDCLDSEGNTWSFYNDRNEYMKGDIVNLLMWALNECEEDDEIVEVYNIGHADDIQTFFSFLRWQ